MWDAAKTLKTCAAFITLGLVACTSEQAALPESAIVSTTLCADSYVHSLPEIEPRLAALSWQSRSHLSQTPEHLLDLPQTSDDPERLMKWKGATQITATPGPGQTDLSWGEDFETVWRNFAKLSAALGVDDPSEAFKARLRDIEKPVEAPLILYLDRSGATAGPGTFVNAVIEAAGGTNIIENPGWQSPDTETLMRLEPDIILTSFMGSDYVGVNDRAYRHAALAEKRN
jgi:iron complex transport system substrate-binding protein